MRFYSVRQYRAWKGRALLPATIFLFLACLLALPARAADTLRVAGLEFDNVLVFGDVEVEISHGDEVELLLRGSAIDLEQQPFLVEGNNLVLGRSRGASGDAFSDVQFKLRTPALSHVEHRGSGDVYIQSFEGERLFVSLAGSGQVRLFAQRAGSMILQLSGSGDLQAAGITAETVKVSLSGSGEVQLGRIDARDMEVALRGSGDISVSDEGQLETLEVNIIGSGDVRMSSLHARSAEVNIVGSGDARVGVVEDLDVNILGSGDVRFAGEPRISQSILGSGDLRATR